MKENLNNRKTEACFLSLPPKQFALLGAILGLAVSEKLNEDEKNSLGNFLVSIGQSMMTAAAQEQLFQEDSSKDEIILREIADLKEQLRLLKQKS